jgi:hypothetical protein
MKKQTFYRPTQHKGDAPPDGLSFDEPAGPRISGQQPVQPRGDSDDDGPSISKFAGRPSTKNIHTPSSWPRLLVDNVENIDASKNNSPFIREEYHPPELSTHAITHKSDRQSMLIP